MTKKVKDMDVVFLLDRSGSMRGIEEDTIGGYNSYINDNIDKDVKVTTVLFDNEYGIITPVGDAVFMATKISELLNNQELYDYYCKQSLNRYNDFLPEKIMKEFVRIVECDYEE